MAFIWTIEGTLMSLGAAAGGWIAETFSPHLAMSITSFAIVAGFTVLTIGRKRLAAADRIPTEEEDLAAMAAISSTNE
jgi:hypothetical protein